MFLSGSEVVNIVSSSFIHIFLIILFEIVFFYVFIVDKIKELADGIRPLYNLVLLANRFTLEDYNNIKNEENTYKNNKNNESIRNSGLILGFLFLFIIVFILVSIYVFKISIDLKYVVWGTFLSLLLIIGGAMYLTFQYLLNLQINGIELGLNFINKTSDYINSL
jgi:hypothetical protein